jgi:hypothetical protein
MTVTAGQSAFAEAEAQGFMLKTQKIMRSPVRMLSEP